MAGILDLRCPSCGTRYSSVDVGPIKRCPHPIGTSKCGARLVKRGAKSARQTDAQRADHAARQYDAAVTRMRRAITSMALWQRRTRYYAAKVAGELKRYERKPKPVKPTRLYGED